MLLDTTQYSLKFDSGSNKINTIFSSVVMTTTQSAHNLPNLIKNKLNACSQQHTGTASWVGLDNTIGNIYTEVKKPELVNENFNWYGYVENPAPVHEMHRTHTILDTNNNDWCNFGNTHSKDLVRIISLKMALHCALLQFWNLHVITQLIKLN